MSTALLQPPIRLLGESARKLAPSGGRMTLEERLRATWRAANTDDTADCPLCGSELTMEGGVAACGSCGSRLS